MLEACRPITTPSSLISRQEDKARTDFAIIEDEIEAVHARLARLPNLGDLTRPELGTIFATTGLIIGWIEVFWR
jgi:hypothetical protein